MTKDNRPIVVRPTLGRLRQGLIFTCASADGYQGCDAFGLIVTAHCDLVHDKAPVINFVPVVSLEQWLARDAETLLARRVRSQLIKELRSQVERLNLSPALLETESPETVVKEFVLSDKTGSVSKRQRERAEMIPAAIADTERVLAGEGIQKNLRTQHPKDARKLLEELLSNSLVGYYFLPCVSPNGEHSGHVALLRQVYHLPRSAANDISRGLSLQDLVHLLGEAPHSGMDVSRELDELVQPVGQLASPFLEHVMQAFGSMFTRIGVTDIADDFESAIIGTHFSSSQE